jgi:uncharacterized protein
VLTRPEIIGLLKNNRESIKRFGVKELGVFGSAARGDAHENSDVDVLVEFERETFDAYMGLLFYLEELFGRKVDLVMKDAIKARIRNRILGETVYVEGF